MAENTLHTVSLGHKNHLFLGSDHGGDRDVQFCGLIGNRRLNSMDRYRHHGLSVIAEWPVNRVGEVQPLRVTLHGE